MGEGKEGEFTKYNVRGVGDGVYKKSDKRLRKRKRREWQGGTEIYEKPKKQ